MSVAVAPNVTYRTYRWTDWKVVVVLKGIAHPQYDDDGLLYTIWGYDGPEVHACQIWKGTVPYSVVDQYSQSQNDADKTDFETNYRAGFNQSLEPRASSGALKVDINSVTTTTGTEPASNVLKQGELAVTTRSEIDATGIIYTVPSGKHFRLMVFEASYDNQSPIYIRLKKQTGGTGNFVTISKIVLKVQGQDECNDEKTWPSGLEIGSPGDVFKVTIEAALIKGNIWVSFSGVEY